MNKMIRLTQGEREMYVGSAWISYIGEQDGRTFVDFTNGFEENRLYVDGISPSELAEKINNPA